MSADLVDLDRSLRWMLAGGLAVLVVLFLAVVATRLIDMAQAERRRELERYYRPIVDALGDPVTAPDMLGIVARAPQRHADTLAMLLLAKLRLVSGEVVDVFRDAAVTIGLDRRATEGLGSPHWWRRAEGAAALGLLRDGRVTPALVALLDDPHERVRAAAVTALGWLADPAAIDPLLVRLADETRYQRVRIVEALQHFGPEVGPPLLAFAKSHPELASIVADLIGQLRLTCGVDQLIEWTGHGAPVIRTSALRALGMLGLDDRAFYYAIRALGDEAAEVRAMAVRSLGRTAHPDAPSYLEPFLDDDWPVAAQAAMALRRLGAEGRLALERARMRGGRAGDLAGQVLWDTDAAATGPAA